MQVNAKQKQNNYNKANAKQSHNSKTITIRMQNKYKTKSQ